MNLVPLAQRIRSHRTAHKLTLEQVAERTGLTKSILSKVENFRVTPSLPTLAKIAEALGTTMSELLAGLDEKPQMVLVRKDQRLLVERDRPNSNILYHALAHTRPLKMMEPFLLEVPPGTARRQRLAHEGEEFIMLMEGTIDYEYGDETFHLNAGDCIYEDGAVKHTLNNPGKTAATVLVVYANHSPATD
ncbi:MAG: cupin domain-containing protein [Pirellulales bacterium]